MTYDTTDDNGTLHDYLTGDELRPATRAELLASAAAAKRDGGAGVIAVDGRACYVVGGRVLVESTPSADTIGVYDVYYWSRGRKEAGYDRDVSDGYVNGAIDRLEKGEGLVAVCRSQNRVPLVVAGIVPAEELQETP